MTKLEIKGAGNITRGKRKQKWARLTDDDLQYAEGKPDGLTGRSQKRMGETREAVAKPSGNFSPPVPAMKRASVSAIKFILLFFAAMVSAACLLAGCQSPRAMSPRESGAIQSTRNNGYSLLHQLLVAQKDVSLLRFIRPEHTDVKELVKKVAKASGAGATLLEKFAKDDPAISLDYIRLPPAELATRDAIAATKKKELLSQSGGTFELTLLLTQTEALSYGWHLAQVTGQNEPQPDRARALAGISADMQNLYREVFALILSKYEYSPTNSFRTQPN